METHRTRIGGWIGQQAYLIIPVGVVLGVAYTGMDLRPLWLDELYTADAVENGLSGIWAHNWEFPLIPYYALMYLWTFGGNLTADWWMRSLSVAFSICAVLYTGLTGRALLSRRVGFTAAFLVAVSPWVAYYNQNARNYTLGAALVAAASYYSVRNAIDSRRVWLSYAAVIALAACFVQTALVFLALNPVVLALAGFGRMWLRPWLRSVVLASPVILLAAFMYVNKGTSMHGWLDPPAIADLWQALPQVTRWEPLALVIVASAVLSRMGLAWLAGVAIGVSAIWAVSHLGSSFWLEGVLGMLVGALALAGASTMQLVSWRYAVTWCALIALVSVGHLYKIQNLPDDTRYAKVLATTVASRGSSTVIATDTTGLALMAMRHYAPEVEVVAVEPSVTPPQSVWHVGDPVECPGAESTQLEDGIVLTFCPRIP